MNTRSRIGVPDVVKRMDGIRIILFFRCSSGPGSLKLTGKNMETIEGDKMKAFTIFLFICLFSLCACSQNLRIMWNPNDTADSQGLKHYVVYKWEGDSTQWLNWKIADMDSIGILPHVLNFSGPYEFQTYFDETKIICAGGLAEDSLGRRGKMRLSRFYFHPGDLEEVWIDKKY